MYNLNVSVCILLKARVYILAYTYDHWLFLLQSKINTTNNAYLLCRSWCSKTQDHLASTKKSNFQKFIIHSKNKKAKEKNCTRRVNKKRELVVKKGIIIYY